MINADVSTVERHEKISELISLTKHQYIELIIRLYNDAKVINGSNNKYILRDFQNVLKQVSQWSPERKRDECERFNLENVTVLLDQIIKINGQLFNSDVAHAAATHLVSINTASFIYENALNVAREVWTKPFLLYHRVNKQDYQKNMMALEKVVINEIKSTVRRIDKLTTKVEIVTVPAPVHTSQPLDLAHNQTQTQAQAQPVTIVQLTPMQSPMQMPNPLEQEHLIVLPPSIKSVDASDSDSDSDSSLGTETISASESETDSNDSDDSLSIDSEPTKNANDDANSKVIKVIRMDGDGMGEDERPKKSKQSKQSKQSNQSEHSNQSKHNTIKKIKKDKYSKKKPDSMQAYSNYLNPYMFSPKRKN